LFLLAGEFGAVLSDAAIVRILVVDEQEVVRRVHADATGDLRRAVRRIGDERRHRPAPPPGVVVPSGRAVEAALRWAE
jgi:hypothetical protein